MRIESTISIELLELLEFLLKSVLVLLVLSKLFVLRQTALRNLLLLAQLEYMLLLVFVFTVHKSRHLFQNSVVIDLCWEKSNVQITDLLVEELLHC